MVQLLQDDGESSALRVAQMLSSLTVRCPCVQGMRCTEDMKECQAFLKA